MSGDNDGAGDVVQCPTYRSTKGKATHTVSSSGECGDASSETPKHRRFNLKRTIVSESESHNIIDEVCYRSKTEIIFNNYLENENGAANTYEDDFESVSSSYSDIECYSSEHAKSSRDELTITDTEAPEESESEFETLVSCIENNQEEKKQIETLDLNANTNDIRNETKETLNENLSEVDESLMSDEELSEHVDELAEKIEAPCDVYKESHEDVTTENKGLLTVRYINSALYIEDVDSRSVDAVSLASLTTDHTTVATSLRSSSTPYMSDQHYHCNGSDTFRLSVTSASTNETAKEQRERDQERRRIAFEIWLAKKKDEKKKKQLLNGSQSSTPSLQSTPEQREATFKEWLERKKAANEQCKRRACAMRAKKEKEQHEALLREREKEEKLLGWLKQKEENLKESKIREERKRSIVAARETKRREAGQQAFRDWLKGSKQKPLPVPLNQGELSMRGSVSDMYVNPVEWQPI